MHNESRPETGSGQVLGAPLSTEQTMQCWRWEASRTPAVMIDREWLECLLTSYYLFVQQFQGDPDIQAGHYSVFR